MKRNKVLSLSALTILGISMGATMYLSTSKTNSYASDTKVKAIKDVSLMSNTTPTNPETDGHVSQDFINRFNNAISLNSEGTKFVINNSQIPTNATETEITALKSLVDQSNKDLAAATESTPESNVSQIDNSVVVAQDAQTAKKVTEQLEGKTLTNVSRFHEGSNFVHVYWWGLRIGVKKSTINSAGNGVAIGGVWLPNPLLAKIVSTAGIVLGAVPGGIVFNSTPGVKSVWGMEFQ